MQSLDQRQELTFKGNREKGRHGWLRLTPAYSLHLVEELIAQGSKRQHVLEPFCGTGTTPLVCAELGIRSTALDINPFLIWLANAKCAAYAPDVGARLSECAQDATSEALESQEVPPALWLPPIKDVDKWWGSAELVLLGRLWAAIKRGDPAYIDLLSIAFCKAAISVANVSFGHQSMSFAKPQSADEPGLFPRAPSEERVVSEFAKAVDGIAATVNARPVQGDGLARVILGDSRDIKSAVGSERFTTVVTSPPYPNRMSYIRELRPYMYWLGFLRDGRQAGELDWKAIGGTWGCATSNLGTWSAPQDIEVPHPEFKDILRRIAKRSGLLATYVHKYFVDAVVHVTNLRPVLRKGARVYYVVGNSKFYDVMLPTEQLYAAIFEAAGLSAVSFRAIRKRTSKKELFEYVVEATA